MVEVDGQFEAFQVLSGVREGGAQCVERNAWNQAQSKDDCGALLQDRHPLIYETRCW